MKFKLFMSCEGFLCEVKSLKEANLKSEGSIDRRTYSFLKILEQNEEFQKEIKEIREQFDLPQNGYPIDEWFEHERKSIEIQRKFGKIDHQCTHKLAPAFKIPSNLTENLKFIVLANYILLPISEIFIQPVYNRIILPGLVTINIQKKISKNKLLELINSNWPLIKKSLDYQFGDERLIFISERDRKIVKLKDEKKKTYKEISTILKNEIDDPEDRINPDSVKSAYHKAKNEMASVKKVRKK